MHTLQKTINGEVWTANFDGDHTGEVMISYQDCAHVSVPWEFLGFLMAEKLRSRRIQEIEDATDIEILYHK